MKIYTRGGDKGTTALIGGRRVPKYHLKIEAYGTIDELMAQSGLLMDMYNNPGKKELFVWVLDRLMTAASLLASDGQEEGLPKLLPDDIIRLENEIDAMEAHLPELRSFILPGGHPVVSACHVTRTVCRRAERIIIRVAEEFKVEELIISFLNRYSDLLFVLSRLIAKELDVDEISWKPKL
ncbi:MAG TPA: cob(I)yrinic acid a,c-diamide adenosyltransferase [Bacteroidales bacterium]|nr:cob(I)yrinic acid a,c-diamide adenosyltransferase [Bacteroidales bacterium]